jgi:ribose transport system substrate-binding protein
MSAPECSVPANAAKEAAERMGIDFHIADGMLNQGGGWEAAVRTALAAKPDALLIHAISCPIVQAPLQEAVDAGVEVMGVEALDCSSAGGPELFTAEMNYAEGMETTEAYFERWGELSAEYVIAATGGEAKVIVNVGNDAHIKLVPDAFVTKLEECDECEVVETVEFAVSDLTPDGPWIQQFRSALGSTPEANAVLLPFDVMVAGAGGAQAVKEAGLELVTAGGSGQAAVIDLVRNGQHSAVTAAHSGEWMGYAAMDNINRVLMGEETVPQGVGFRVVDPEHNLPPEEGQDYVSPIDFKAAYNEIWPTP